MFEYRREENLYVVDFHQQYVVNCQSRNEDMNKLTQFSY